MADSSDGPADIGRQSAEFLLETEREDTSPVYGIAVGTHILGILQSLSVCIIRKVVFK